MSHLNSTSCCGVGEIANLAEDRGHKETIDQILSNDLYAIYLFTDAVEYGNGTGFRDFIRKNRLGRVIETHAVENHNSGNDIKAWLWTPNSKNLFKFAKKHQLGDWGDHDNEDYDY